MTNVNVRVAESLDDGIDTTDAGFPGEDFEGVLWYGDQDSGNRLVYTGAIFNGLSIPSGATIDDADVTYTDVDFGSSGIGVNVHCEDVSGSPGAYSAGDSPHDRARTTASTAWAISVGSAATVSTPDLVDEFQEIVDSYGDIDDAGVVLVGDGADAGIQDFESFDTSAGDAPLLDLNYTAGAGATTRRYGLTLTGVG